jgi:nicotinamidase-related amidase
MGYVWRVIILVVVVFVAGYALSVILESAGVDLLTRAVLVALLSMAVASFGIEFMKGAV